LELSTLEVDRLEDLLAEQSHRNGSVRSLAHKPSSVNARDG
jgi:hypothetical protein